MGGTNEPVTFCGRLNFILQLRGISMAQLPGPLPASLTLHHTSMESAHGVRFVESGGIVELALLTLVAACWAVLGAGATSSLALWIGRGSRSPDLECLWQRYAWSKRFRFLP